MKIDVTQPIKEYDGRDIIDDAKKPVPIRTVMLNALALPPSGPDPDNPGQQLHMTNESREQRFAISTKLWAKKEVKLTISEKAFIIKCAEVAFVDNPLIFGRIKQVLEGEGQTIPSESPEPTTEPENAAEQS